MKSQLNTLNPSFPEAGDPGNPGIWVDNIDAVVRKVIANAQSDEIEAATKRVLGLSSSSARPYTERDAAQVWEAAVEGASDELPRALANTTFLQQEYEAVVLANAITTQGEYLKVARTGRGTPLNRKQRKLVWSILESVMQTQAVDLSLIHI